MSGGTFATVIVVLVIIAALIAAGAVTTRRRRLQQQFWPEHERAVPEQNNWLRAEARRLYAADWVAIQEQFVDSPQTAIGRAYDLVVTVMTERGYPADDTGQVMNDLPVEHATTVGHFRAAQQITGAAAAGAAATEDLRQAMIHYRALFSDLLGADVAEPATRR